MTYYVPKNDFYKGDVADADGLMNEFYSAAEAISRIDQNNIATNGITYSVAIPPNSSDEADRHRGPFACYNDTGLLYDSGRTIPSGLINGKWTESGTSLSFTSRVAAHYTFLMQAVAWRNYSHPGPLRVDGGVTLNGTLVSRTMASVSSQVGADYNYVPMFFMGTEFIEPGTWTVTPVFRPMVHDNNMPQILEISVGVVGFIR